MWIMVVTLLLMQQETGTPVDAKTIVIESFSSESVCENGAKKLMKSYSNQATEPTTGSDSDQPKAEQFELMVPLIDCIEKR